MIVDTSALVAILLREPGHEHLEAALATSAPAISAGTMIEARIVITAKAGPVGRRRLDALLRTVGARIIAIDEHQADIAADAYRDFGRGSQHPARLNFGDCFAYALAVVADEPLLYVGDDFSHTDVRSALG